ncbi:MAG: POTRA domain-containing protein [Coleofasciculus sp.]|uniref:POTRA domain-containing protein n=1 Tax=Coleofasciculus sp. TaxID=3100458 RepID=UPI003A4526EF
MANPPLTLPEPTEHFPAFDFAQQPNPNEDRFLQPTPEPIPSEPTETEPVLPTPEEPVQPPPSESTETTIDVNRIEVVGSTVFGAEEFNPIIQPLEGRTVTINELQNATDAIAHQFANIIKVGICHWSLVIGHLSLVICHWSLVIGHLSLVIGHWSFVRE